jgi:hypothetical protein
MLYRAPDLAGSCEHVNIATQVSEVTFNICETNTMARKTQLQLCNCVATWMESYFVQTCVAQNIFVQHDWSWMGKLVLHKTFLRNMIDREWAKLCCTKHFCATWLIVNGQSCVAQNIFAQHDWSWMGKVVLDKTFLRNMIDREWANLFCRKHYCATWLIVNGQSCVAQNIFAQHDWSWIGPLIRVSIKLWFYLLTLFLNLER